MVKVPVAPIFIDTFTAIAFCFTGAAEEESLVVAVPLLADDPPLSDDPPIEDDPVLAVTVELSLELAVASPLGTLIATMVGEALIDCGLEPNCGEAKLDCT